MAHPQDEAHRQSLADPEGFWSRQAEQLYWHKKPSAALERTAKLLPSGASHSHWTWFPGGEISTCYNCVDRHVLAGRGDDAAIFYDSPVTGTKQRLTYAQLLDEVEMFAAVLRQEGVGKEDVVLVYMPMIPAALIGILATNRLGAIHTVVFGGFASAALAQRIEASRPAVILTASCGVEGAKPPIPYQLMFEEAVGLSAWKPPRTIIWQRDQQISWHPIAHSSGQRSWQDLVQSACVRGVTRPVCMPVPSTDPVYIIYTSGTTGAPKGVVRDAGGHAVGLHLSTAYLFGVRGPGDVMACLSDIGWVVGHSYTLYGPLLRGAATVLYEGKPVGTPDASAFWRLVAEYSVSTLFTAPTALRAIRRDDPDNRAIARVGAAGGLRSLRALFLAGERSEPALVDMYGALLREHGAPPGAVVVDNWWSSESGSPISGLALAPRTAWDEAGAAVDQNPPPLEVRPGSAGKPMPGFDVRVVDDQGDEVPRGTMGNIVMVPPLAPTAFRTLWGDEERFYKGYLKRFGGRWFDTGDAGVVDKDGYISIVARSDDIINVAAHRLSTGTLEQAITSHPNITEAAVVGIPDALKGHLPFAFVATSPRGDGAPEPDDDTLLCQVQALVRSQIGAIATLGGMIRGRSGAHGGGDGGGQLRKRQTLMIPRTRSGKTLRRVLRELVENAARGEFDKPVSVPSTIEDPAAVEVARERVRDYFGKGRAKL